jgi:exportin-5
MPLAIEDASCLGAVCNCLTVSDEDIIMLAVDSLITLYGRVALVDRDVQTLVYPLCQPASVAILQQVYQWSVVGVDDILTQRYTISKKLSELVSLLADLLIRLEPPDQSVLDASAFLKFMITIARHDSLIVSIPAVHSWDRICGNQHWRRNPVVSDCVSELLQVISPRVVQYDQLPEDTEEPAVIFVNEEIEIFPERQGFYLNYRRLCSQVVEWVCYIHLEQAVHFVLSQVDTALLTIQQQDSSFNPADFRRITPLSLHADAQFSIADAAFKGLDRYLSSRSQGSDEQKELGGQVREQCKTWALTMLSKYRFNDPSIIQRQIKTVVEISSKALRSDTDFAVSVLEHILASFIPLKPEHASYSHGVQELWTYITAELRRLAQYHADYFATFYDQLSAKFGEIIANLQADGKVQIESRFQTDLKSILFLIMQRAPVADLNQQQSRLWAFLEPLSTAWSDTSLHESLASFESYCKSQGFDNVAPYLSAINAGQIEDWTTVETNQDGLHIQQQMQEAFARLPLRETRVLLATSTERLEQNSTMHQLICELWAPMMPQILEGVLKITSYNHRLHDSTTWTNSPMELAVVIKRVLRDRYWQSGISEGSMNDFHSRVKQTKSTLEGFASSIRGRIRTNLEQCYSIIHALGRLGDRYFGMQQVPQMIAETVIGSAAPLSSHHFSVLLQMLPKLIEECPPKQRQHFLTPVLCTLLEQIDTKLTSEWHKAQNRKERTQDGDSLSDEMRDESVLRQTTYKAVNMVALWLSPRREVELAAKKSIVNGAHLHNGYPSQSMADYVLSNQRLLEPLLVFVTHALTYKDTKAAQVMISAAQRVVPVFASEEHLQGDAAASVREYISTEMLKAAITALNDSHFADIQQYYAQLIAYIWIAYGLPTHVAQTESQPAHERPPLTHTPQNVLLGLPNMDQASVESAAARLMKEGASGKSKKLRAVILHLLEGVRGVRISDLGKIDTRAQQSRILEKYKQRESLGMQGVEAKADPEQGDLGPIGLAELEATFGTGQQ